MICYLDTSVVVKTLTTETESDAVIGLLVSFEQSGDTFVSSGLLITETHRAAQRLSVSVDEAESALDLIELIDVTNEVLRRAGALQGSMLRSLDAIHVATALEVEAGVFVTADVHQSAAARGAGLNVVDKFD